MKLNKLAKNQIRTALAALGATAVGTFAVFSIVHSSLSQSTYNKVLAEVTGPSMCYPHSKLSTVSDEGKLAAKDKTVTFDEINAGNLQFVSPDRVEKIVAYYEQELGLDFNAVGQNDMGNDVMWSAQVDEPDFHGTVNIFKTNQDKTIIGLTPKASNNSDRL